MTINHDGSILCFEFLIFVSHAFFLGTAKFRWLKQKNGRKYSFEATSLPQIYLASVDNLSKNLCLLHNSAISRRHQNY